MTQEEVLAFIAQQNGGNAGKALYSKVAKQIDNPLAGTPGHLADPEKITVTVEQWKTPDGQVIFEGYRDPSSDQYVALQQNTPKPATASASATGANADELQRQRERNQAAGAGYYTDAEISEGIVAGQKAEATKTETARKENETKKNTWTTVKTETVKDEAGGTARTVQTQQNGLGETRPVETTVQELKPGETYGKPVQGADGQVQPVLDANGKIIRYEPMPEGGPPKETPLNAIPLPNGGKGNLIADPSQPSGYRVEAIPGTEKKDTALPSVDLTQATMGKYTDALKKKWDDTFVPLINAGTITMADALKQFEVDQKMAEAKANEEISQLNAQQNIRSQDVSQRGQTLGEVQNQRSNLQNTMQTALQVVKPADFGKYTPGAIKEIVDMYGGMQDKFGIPKGVPSPQPYTQQQQQVMGAPGPAPIVFNINTGGAVPTSAPMANLGTQMGLPGGVPETPGMADMSQPPQNPEQILDEMRRNSPDQFWNDAVDRVGGNLQAAREKAAGGVAPGMSLSGGQLRAPGMGPVGAGPVGQVG